MPEFVQRPVKVEYADLQGARQERGHYQEVGRVAGDFPHAVPELDPAGGDHDKADGEVNGPLAGVQAGDDEHSGAEEHDGGGPDGGAQAAPVPDAAAERLHDQQDAEEEEAGAERVMVLCRAGDVALDGVDLVEGQRAGAIGSKGGGCGGHSHSVTSSHTGSGASG